MATLWGDKGLSKLSEIVLIILKILIHVLLILFSCCWHCLEPRSLASGATAMKSQNLLHRNRINSNSSISKVIHQRFRSFGPCHLNWTLCVSANGHDYKAVVIVFQYGGVCYIENNAWARRYGISLQVFSSLVSAANEWGVELNTRREIPYLQATMYYFVYHRNTIALYW